MKILFIGGRFKGNLENKFKEKHYVKTAITKNILQRYLSEKFDIYFVDSFNPGTFEPFADGVIEAIKTIFEKERKSNVIVYTDNSNLKDAVRFLPYKVPVESKNKTIESLIEKYSKEKN